MKINEIIDQNARALEGPRDDLLQQLAEMETYRSLLEDDNERLKAIIESVYGELNEQRDKHTETEKEYLATIDGLISGGSVGP